MPSSCLSRFLFLSLSLSLSLTRIRLLFGCCSLQHHHRRRRHLHHHHHPSISPPSFRIVSGSSCPLNAKRFMRIYICYTYIYRREFYINIYISASVCDTPTNPPPHPHPPLPVRRPRPFGSALLVFFRSAKFSSCSGSAIFFCRCECRLECKTEAKTKQKKQKQQQPPPPLRTGHKQTNKQTNKRRANVFRLPWERRRSHPRSPRRCRC